MQRSKLDSKRIRSWAGQFCVVAVLALAAFYSAHNAVENLAARHIPVGFSFLRERAGFDIEETLMEWTPSDSYGRVILVGLTNTLIAAFVSIVLSTLLGLLIALMRLSSNPLFRGTAAAFVELMRNTPQLLLVVFWYSVVLRSLPSPRQSYDIGSVIFLNVRGLYLPRLDVVGGFGFIISMLAGIVFFSFLLGRLLKGRPIRNKKLINLFVCLALIAVVFSFAIKGVMISYPRLKGFNFIGGMHLFPEFVALTFALSLCWAAYIGETVRGGILSVDRGQVDAAMALGLRRGLALRLVVIPQALQVIVPPLSSEYLSLTKATSLGVAVGYPELVTLFAGIVLARTGQEIEVMLITMTTYLTMNLIISMLMNLYNARVKVASR